MNPDSDREHVMKAGYRVTDAWQGVDDLQRFLARHPAGDGPWLIDNYDLAGDELDLIDRAGICAIVVDDVVELEEYRCDVIVNPSPDASAKTYRCHDRTVLCLGTDFFPVRPEFLKLADEDRSKSDLVVTFGGSDPDDQTARVVAAVDGLGIASTVILGPGYRGNLSPREDIEIVQSPDRVAPYFGGARIAVCGGGGTALEFAYLGVPTVIVAVAENQIANALALEKAGAAHYLGRWTDISEQDIRAAIEALASDAYRRASMSANGKTLVDGKFSDRMIAAISTAWRGRQPVDGGLKPATT
jgi:UDP-2,4-diacetamido-2,4,6-trideoxy-beta-L-altropyranose hydrolase